MRLINSCASPAGLGRRQDARPLMACQGHSWQDKATYGVTSGQVPGVDETLQNVTRDTPLRYSLSRTHTHTPSPFHELSRSLVPCLSLCRSLTHTLSLSSTPLTIQGRYSLSLSLPLSLARSLIPSLSLSHTHSVTHTHFLFLTHPLSHLHPLSFSQTLSLTHTLSLSSTRPTSRAGQP